MQIEPRAFEALWPLTAGRRVRKVRHYVPIAAELRAEIDVYAGALDGLRTAEIEFDSLAEADRFVPPPWLGAELTGDERYANQSLATVGLPAEQRKRDDVPMEIATSSRCLPAVRGGGRGERDAPGDRRAAREGGRPAARARRRRRPRRGDPRRPQRPEEGARGAAAGPRRARRGDLRAGEPRAPRRRPDALGEPRRRGQGGDARLAGRGRRGRRAAGRDGALARGAGRRPRPDRRRRRRPDRERRRGDRGGRRPGARVEDPRRRLEAARARPRHRLLRGPRDLRLAGRRADLRGRPRAAQTRQGPLVPAAPAARRLATGARSRPRRRSTTSPTCSATTTISPSSPRTSTGASRSIPPTARPCGR